MASIDDLIKELELDNLEMEEGVPLSKAQSPTRESLVTDISPLTVNMTYFNADNATSFKDGNTPSLSNVMKPSAAVVKESEDGMAGEWHAPSGSESANSEKSNSTTHAVENVPSASPKEEEVPLEEDVELPPASKVEKQGGEKPVVKKEEKKSVVKRDTSSVTPVIAKKENTGSQFGEKTSHCFDSETEEPPDQNDGGHTKPSGKLSKTGSGASALLGNESSNSATHSRSSPSESQMPPLSQGLLNDVNFSPGSPLAQRFTVPFPTNPSSSSQSKNMSRVLATLRADEDGEGGSPLALHQGLLSTRSRGRGGRGREPGGSSVVRCPNCCYLTSDTREDLPPLSIESLIDLADPAKFVKSLGENKKIPTRAEIMRRKGAYYAYLQEAVGNGALDCHGDPKEEGGCPFIKCLKCQCIVIRLKGAEWKDDKGQLNLYLTLRNYYPDWSRFATAVPVVLDKEFVVHGEDSQSSLSTVDDEPPALVPSEPVLEENPRAVAYCCQCSWLTLFAEKAKITTLILDAAAYRQQESITTHPFATRFPLQRNETRRLPLWTCAGHVSQVEGN